MCGRLILTYWSCWWTLWLMDDLVHSPSSISSLEKATSIGRSTFVSVWVSLGERSVKVWLISITSQVQIGEGTVLASQRRVGSHRTYHCPMMTPSSLRSNSLAKGCSQAMSWWTMSCPKKCGPSRSLFAQYTALEVQQPYQLWLGTVQVQECGGRDASSDQTNIDAPYLTHQLCGYEGQKLCNTSPMLTAPSRKWMEACRGRVYPSLVSLQTSTSCRLGTDQMWLQDILQGSLFMQEKQSPLHCSLQMPQFWLQQPSWLGDEDEDDV